MATIQELRALNAAIPFRPFQIRLPSGKTVIVATSDSVFCPPNVKQMTLYDAEGHIHLSTLSEATFEPVDDETVRLIRKRQAGPQLRPVADAVTSFGFQPYHLYKILSAEPFCPFTLYMVSGSNYYVKESGDFKFEDGVLKFHWEGKVCLINPGAISSIEINS